MVQAIVGAVKMTRPLNCLSALGSAILGGYLTSAPSTPRLWIAATVAATLTATGNVVGERLL